METEVKSELAKHSANGCGGINHDATFECGCKAARVSGGIMLERCLTHALAPEMYALLRDTEDSLNGPLSSSDKNGIRRNILATLSKIDGGE